MMHIKGHAADFIQEPGSMEFEHESADVATQGAMLSFDWFCLPGFLLA